MNIRIKEIRDFLDLTQEEFGKRIGSARNTIANYENGNRNPSNSVLLSICREFNVNENWLRTGEGEMLNVLPRNQIITDFLGDVIQEDGTFKKRLIEALANMNESGWIELEKLANELIKKD